MSYNHSVLITGAGGFIGKHAIQAFFSRGWNVIVVDPVKNEWPDYVEVKNVNIFEKNENLYEELGKPELCLHLAWKDGFVHGATSHIENIYAHFDFLKNLVDAGIPKLAVMGSMHEVGYWEGAISENTPCNPLSLYGIAKNTLRQAISVYAADKTTKLYWLRGYYIMGDEKNNHSIFSKILEKDKAGEMYFPFNSGKNKYDFIDIDEMACKIERVLSQTEVTGIINICSGKPVSLADKVNEFLDSKKCSIKLQYGAFPDRSYDSPAVWGDTSKLEKALRAAGE